jgi:hypothetical protein
MARLSSAILEPSEGALSPSEEKMKDLLSDLKICETEIEDEKDVYKRNMRALENKKAKLAEDIKKLGAKK